MNDEEQKNLWQALKCLWQEQKPSSQPALTGDEQIAAMRKKMTKMHRGLITTDFLGLAIYGVVIVTFTICFFTTRYFAARIGSLIIIGGDLFALWKIIQRRRSIPQPIADAPVMEWLKYDLATVHQHAEESRTLLLWYLLPFLIGMNVSTWGMKVDLLTVKIPMTVLVVLIAGVTYWLNQRVWRNQWLPMQQELEALLNSDQPVLPPEPPKKNIMTRTILIGIVLILLGAIVFVRGRDAKTEAIAYPDSVSQMLENIGVKHNFPALIAAVTVHGTIVV